MTAKTGRRATTATPGLIPTLQENMEPMDLEVSNGFFSSGMYPPSRVVTEVDLFTVPSCNCKYCTLYFPVPSRRSLTKLSLDENNLIVPVQGEFGK